MFRVLLVAGVIVTFASVQGGTLQLAFPGGLWLQVPSPAASVSIVNDGAALDLGDERIAVVDLLDGLFGAALRRHWARQGGLTRSPKRAAASRRNGRKGGRHKG